MTQEQLDRLYAEKQLGNIPTVVKKAKEIGINPKHISIGLVSYDKEFIALIEKTLGVGVHESMVDGDYARIGRWNYYPNTEFGEWSKKTLPRFVELAKIIDLAKSRKIKTGQEVFNYIHKYLDLIIDNEIKYSIKETNEKYLFIVETDNEIEHYNPYIENDTRYNISIRKGGYENTERVIKLAKSIVFEPFFNVI